MSNLQKKTKFKFTQLAKKGLKFLKKSPNAVVIKSKEGHLMSPQQGEVFKCIFSKLVREEYGALSLNIKFFPHLSISKTPLQTPMGKGKGKHDKWIILTKTFHIKAICVKIHEFIVIFWLKISVFSGLVEIKDNNKFYKI